MNTGLKRVWSGFIFLLPILAFSASVNTNDQQQAYFKTMRYSMEG
jgi:hypothetical protein